MYYYQPPYNGGKPVYSQDQVMVVHQAQEPVYSRPPPPSDASYQRIRAIQQPPPPPPAAVPAPPPKATEKKSRLAQPPPHPPAPPAKQAPPPPAPVALKPKVEERQISLPQRPAYAPDLLKAPGCFDIVARGGLPAISFFTDILL
jgi:hypothetical protein